MAVVSSHRPGNFCWFELSTSDWQSARAFYTSLFGWSANEVPMEEGKPPYVMVQKEGKDVGALYQADSNQGPPNWMVYVSVADADASAKKASQLGGTIVAEPFDVYDFGRMVVVRDPQGAFFSLWQPKKHVGATRVGENGTTCWSELHTSDPAAAKKFYTSLFGWSPKDSPEYIEVSNGGEPIGGITKSRAAQAPPFWLTYFAVEDCDAAAKKAQSLGGNVHVAPMDIPNVGRFAVIMDPQGASFAIIKLAY
jgi:hypothetical protein